MKIEQLKTKNKNTTTTMSKLWLASGPFD